MQDTITEQAKKIAELEKTVKALQAQVQGQSTQAAKKAEKRKETSAPAPTSSGNHVGALPIVPMFANETANTRQNTLLTFVRNIEGLREFPVDLDSTVGTERISRNVETLATKDETSKRIKQEPMD
jgi:hypothetical protein